VEVGNFSLWSTGRNETDLQDVDLEYGMNLPIVSYFLSPKEIMQVSGDWKIKEDPLVETFVPELRIQRTRIQSALDADAKISVRLSHAVKYMTQGRALVEAEEGLYEHDDKSFWAIKTWGWVEYGTLVSMVVIGAIILVMAVICVRLQRVVTTVGFLGSMRKSYGASVETFKPWVRGLATAPSRLGEQLNNTEEVVERGIGDMEVMLQKYEEIIRVVNFHEFEMMVGLIVLCLVLAAIISRIRKCYKRIKRSTIRTHFGFQFTNGSMEVVIKSQLFHSITNDLRLSTEIVPTEFHVLGCLFPVLQFSWEAVVLDLYHEDVHVVKTRVSLSWIEAMLMRRIIPHRFEVTPVVSYGGVVSVIRREGDDDEDDEEKRESDGLDEVGLTASAVSLPTVNIVRGTEGHTPMPVRRRPRGGWSSQQRSFRVAERRTPLFERKRLEFAEKRKRMTT
jgi:hypothetical protein